MEDEIGTLKIGEVHPAAHDAMQYVKGYLLFDLANAMMLIESFASNALSGNRLAEICGETLRRVMHGEPVSDRYIFGLAWTLKNTEERENKND